MSPDESVLVESVVASVTFSSTSPPVVTFLSVDDGFVVDEILDVVVVVVDVRGVVVAVDVSFVEFSRECPCIKSERKNREKVTWESPIFKFVAKI